MASNAAELQAIMNLLKSTDGYKGTKAIDDMKALNSAKIAMPESSLSPLELPRMSLGGGDISDLARKQASMGGTEPSDSALMQQLMGKKGTPNVVMRPVDGKIPDVGGTGYLGGKISKLELAQGLTQGVTGDAQNTGFNLVEKLLTDKNQQKLFTGGVSGDPLQRQNYVLDDNGNTKPIGPAYQAYQTPTTYSPPIVTTKESHPEYPEGTVLQLDNRGQYKKLHQPDAKILVHQEPNGDIYQVNQDTGEMRIHPASDQERKSTGVQNLANRIDSKISDLMKNGYDPTAITPTSAKDKVVEALAGSENPSRSSIGTAFMSPQAQQYYGERMEWNENFLRDESGAAIGRSEWSSKDRVYWPRPGDSAEEVENKRLRRQDAVDKVTGRGFSKPPQQQQPPQPSVTPDQAKAELARRRALGISR